MKNQNLDALCVNDEIRIAAVFLWLLLLVPFFFTSLELLEGQVLVAHPQVDKEEFQRTLDSFENGKSFIEWFLQSASAKELLKFEEALKEAQFAYLSGSLDHAKDQFESIATHSWSESLMYQKSKSLSYAIFRRAQFAEDPVEQRHWMKLSWMLNPSLDPNSDYFPPPFVESWKASRLKFTSISFEIPRALRMHSKLLVNGKLLSISEVHKIGVAVGKSKFVFLSYFYQPAIFNLNFPLQTSDLVKLRDYKPTPFVAKLCSEEKDLESKEIEIKLQIFTPAKCKKTKNEPTVLSSLNLKMDPNVEFRKAEIDSAKLPSKQNPKSSVSTTRLRWIVLGAIGVAAAFVVKNQNSRSSKNEESKTPSSHREDF